MRLFHAAVLVAMVFALAVPPIGYAQGGAPEAGQNLPVEFFDRMMTELSNWGRWGKNDQKGATNLITPARGSSPSLR
jgi:hypothetical protein